MPTDKNNFRFWVPLSDIKKAKDKDGKEIMKIGGIASTKRLDTDGEQLFSEGMDISYLTSRGIINLNHVADDVIGEPTLAEKRKQGLYVEGILYPDVPKARKAYNTALAMEKSGTRRMGWSVEGKVIERHPDDPTKVLKSKITNVALTYSPKNIDSIVDIIKGEYHGWNDDEKPPVLEAIDFDEANGGDQHILDITRPDGKRVTIDKDYNIKIHKGTKTNIPVGESEDDVIDDEEAGKSKKALTTTTGAAVIPEHVDGETKPMLNGGPQPKIKKGDTEEDDEESPQGLTEEEVICRIMKSNSVITFEKANQIFQTLNTLTMSKTGKTTQISDDLLEKSLAKLGFEKSEKVTKGKKTGGENEEDIDEEEEDEDEGGKEPAGKNKKPGLKKSVKKGYKKEDEEDDEEDPEEEDRDEEDNEDEKPDGGAKKKKAMKKSVRPTLRKSITADYIEDESETLEAIGELKDMVKSLAVIGKHSYDLVKSQADEIAELREQIEAFGEAPAGQRKSVKKAVERNFEKGMGTEDTLEKSEDGSVRVDVDRCKNQVLNMMDHLTFNKGVNGAMNEQMARGMSLFEASGIITPDIQKSIENEFKVKLVRSK
jgi:hypothetical protein